MSAAFDLAFEVVIGHEGGYVNDPDDPGQATKFGISQRAFPAEDIIGLTLERAKEIYMAKYWNTAKCDLLPQAVARVHFDTAVNQGVGTAAKILQKAAGVVVDGAIGPKTLEAAGRITATRYTVFRLSNYMKIIGKRPKSAKYARGWAKRALTFVEPIK